MILSKKKNKKKMKTFAFPHHKIEESLYVVNIFCAKFIYSLGDVKRFQMCKNSDT